MLGRKPFGRLTERQCKRCKHPSQAAPGRQLCSACLKKNQTYLQSAKIQRAAARKERMRHPEARERVRRNNTRNRESHIFRVRAYMFNWKYNSQITPSQLSRLWHSQRGKCVLSGEKLTVKTAHLDHIIPRSRGGATIITNLRWLHEVVNHAKWNFSDVEFLSFCQKVVAHAATK